jgi:hypothetical protein
MHGKRGGEIKKQKVKRQKCSLWVSESLSRGTTEIKAFVAESVLIFAFFLFLRHWLAGLRMAGKLLPSLLQC